MNIISGVKWDVKAEMPIKVIGGNANEFAYVRVSELIEGSWWSVLLRDQCDVDRLVMLKIVVLDENSSITFIGFNF
jgi:hypothetical protein